MERGLSKPSNANSLAVIAGALLVLAAGIYFVTLNNGSQPYSSSQPGTTETPPATPTRTATPLPTHSPVATQTRIGAEDIARLKNVSTYHPLLWPDSTARWAAMPLKVFLNTTREKYLADYQRAAETWENGTGGAVSFVLTNSSGEADITFVWIETVLSDEGSRLGWTEPLATKVSEDFYVIKRATITMRIEAGPCDADTSIINVVAHELGHALGLGHETRYNDDLMKEQLKCQFYELPTISENARMALTEIYRIQKINSG